MHTYKGIVLAKGSKALELYEKGELASLDAHLARLERMRKALEAGNTKTYADLFIPNKQK